MVIIGFSNGTEWFKANWAFRQLAGDVATTFPLDQEVNLEMEKAQAIGALFLKDMNGSLRMRVTDHLRTVAQRTLDGEIEGWRKNDADGNRMYLESLSELITLIDGQ